MNSFRKYWLVPIVALFVFACEKEQSPRQHSMESDATKRSTQRSLVDEDQERSRGSLAGNNSLDRSPQLPPPDLPGEPRMPKIENFDNVPEVAIDRQMQEFLNLFEGLEAGSMAYRNQYKSVWNEIVAAGFDDPLGEGQSSETDLLMERAREVIRNGRAERDELSFASNDREKLAGRQLTWLATLDSMSGGHQLAEQLQERANSWPPTELDLAILYAASQGMRELNPSTNKPILEDWKPLADARNPIYRLIALKAAIYSAPEAALHLSTEDPKYAQEVAPAKAEFYERYLDEDEPVVLLQLISSIRTLVAKESVALLEDLRSNPVVEQTDELKNSLEENHAKLLQRLE